MSNNEAVILDNLQQNIQLFIKREDLLHPHISGNKYRKLKYNLLQAKHQNKKTLITFGGAFSNHIAATAYAGKVKGFSTVGIIRGEELVHQVNTNPTLRFAKSCGMDLVFVTRADYKQKNSPAFIEDLKSKYKESYIIPEGGTNALAIKGCEEILEPNDKSFDYVCTAVGTGGTISGLINASYPHQKILGFPALKGAFLQQDICKFVKKRNWELIQDYHFGGYGKINQELVTFINTFKDTHHIPLDPLYTGKMVFGVLDLISKNYFKPKSKLLIIHTGGLQGIAGMNLKLKQKNLPQLNV